MRYPFAALAVAPILALPALAQVQGVGSPYQSAGGQFGSFVAAVPDFNGDGRGDFVVTAYNEAPPGHRGKGVYLVSGATGKYVRTLINPDPNYSNSFGEVVAGIPDVNGDGRGDIIVGAPYTSFGPLLGQGRAYIYSGANGALLRTLNTPSPVVSGNFGISVSGIPDINGDGRGDVVVGAWAETAGGKSKAGRAHVFSGATGALIRTLYSPDAQVHGFFGSMVAGLPDVNGDGRGDIAVAAKEANNPGMSGWNGRIYIYSGSTGVRLRTLVPRNVSENLIESFGRTGPQAWLSGVPDVNGDGRGDILVGGSCQCYPYGIIGRAWLFSGYNGALLRAYESPLHGQSYGTSVSGSPDINGDGRGDVIIGAPNETVGSVSGAGRVFVFSGATGAPIKVIWSPTPETFASFGSVVAGVADLNGNGRADVVVGAPGQSPGSSPENCGRAYIFKY